jgi:hypothetical protein
VEGLHIGELGDTASVAPFGEATRGVQVCLAGVLIVYLGGKEFDEPASVSPRQQPRDETIFVISDCCCGVKLRAASADASLSAGRIQAEFERAMLRERTKAGLTAPTICIIMRPAGIVVSIASVSLRSPALQEENAPTLQRYGIHGECLD